MTMRVKTKFEAKDDVSSVARRIENNVRRMNRDMQRGFKQSTRSALRFKDIFGGVTAAGIASKGMGLLSRGVGELATQFISFDDAITAAAVRFKDIGPDSKNFTKDLDKIKTAAREAGATTVFTMTQSAQALDFLARAGFNSEEAMGALNTMINLSVATGSDFARAADISSDLLGAFSLNADNAAQKIKNLTRLNDVLTFTANSANVNLEDMFETMKDIAPIATQNLGMSLEEVAGITAKLGDSGIKGTKAMTAMRGIFLSLAAPTSEGGQILKALQIDVFDKLGNPRKFVNIMSDLKVALNGVSTQSRNMALKGIFGKIPLAGATTFLRDVDKIDLFIKKAREAEGVSARSADKIGGSLGNLLTKLGSGFLDLGFNILGGEQKFKSFVETVTKGVNAISQSVKEVREKGFEFDFAAMIPGLKPFTDVIFPMLEKSWGSVLAEQKQTTQPDFIKNLLVPPELQPILNMDQFNAQEIPLAPQPQLNVNVENNINAEGITVDSTIKAPGTSAGQGANSF